MVARMPRYSPAPPGIRSAARMRSTGQNGSSRHVLPLSDSSSEIIIECRSGLLICGFRNRLKLSGSLEVSRGNRTTWWSPHKFGELIPQVLQHPFGTAHPIEILPQPRQPGIEPATEVDVFPRRQQKRKPGTGIDPHRDHWLLASESQYPLRLASGVILHAVLGHHKQHAPAGLDRILDLDIPVCPRPLIPHIQPYRVRRRPGNQLICYPLGEVLCIDPRVTDEIALVHARPPQPATFNQRLPSAALRCRVSCLAKVANNGDRDVSSYAKAELGTVRAAHLHSRQKIGRRSDRAPQSGSECLVMPNTCRRSAHRAAPWLLRTWLLCSLKSGRPGLCPHRQLCLVCLVNRGDRLGCH
jgi:hypothetical protein